MRLRFGGVLIIAVFGLISLARACIWDSKTLTEEQHDHPALAQAILHPKSEAPDVKALTARIQELKTKPQTNDPAWWNELAGAHLRLGNATEAVKILEPLTNRFANDYGIHANLGTGYHLLGRYSSAEREIRRDLQINTNAHFGLEKYHLALLQYLSKNKEYQFRRVYVDEFSLPFLMEPGHLFLRDGYEKDFFDNKIAKDELKSLQKEMKDFLQAPGQELDSDHREFVFRLATQDPPASYRSKWDLSKDPKLDDGVIYMATLNPKEPACWVMLGLVARFRGDINLTKTAFEKAIQLGSLQTPILNLHLKELKKFHPPQQETPKPLHIFGPQ
jgi:hypothetical protein